MTVRSRVVLRVGLPVVFLACVATTRAAEPVAAEWKAGTAQAVITPAGSMWMAGYASRKKPSEGVAQDLHAKALVLEDRVGQRLALVTCDLIGIPRGLLDEMRVDLQARCQIPPAGLLLNASHTHCGPELRTSKAALSGPQPERVEQSRQYLESLRAKLVQLVEQAVQRLEPAHLGYTHGRAGFAMNRRLPTEKGYVNRPYPDGPVDHDVPVLRVDSPAGTLRTLVFGYACHNTTLSFFQFCGDYAGYAQQYLQDAHPDMTAMFLTGCGADQNPQPRGTLELAQQHGRALANGVEAALLGPARPVRGTLRMAVDEVALDFAASPSREELQKQAGSSDEFERRHAELLLREWEQEGAIRSRYPYVIQVIRCGDDLLLIALSGEVVVDYSLRLKQEYAGTRPVWVAAYCHDVFGYVPSARVLAEGGYEARDATRYSILPGPFTESIEERIVAKVRELVARTE